MLKNFGCRPVKGTDHFFNDDTIFINDKTFRNSRGPAGFLYGPLSIQQGLETQVV